MRGENEDTEKGGERKLPAEAEKVGRGDEESESGDEKDKTERSKGATDIAE